MDSIKCDSTKCYYQHHGECHCTMDSYCKYRDSLCWDEVQSRKEAMVDYIHTTPFATVGELVTFLETQDASLPIAIFTDSEKEFPIVDIGMRNGKLVICDF